MDALRSVTACRGHVFADISVHILFFGHRVKRLSPFSITCVLFVKSVCLWVLVLTVSAVAMKERVLETYDTFTSGAAQTSAAPFCAYFVLYLDVEMLIKTSAIKATER